MEGHTNPGILLAWGTKFCKVMPYIFNTSIAVFVLDVKMCITLLELSRKRQIRGRFTDHFRTGRKGGEWGFGLWNLLHVTSLDLIIWRWLVEFGKFAQTSPEILCFVRYHDRRPTVRI